MSDISTQQLLDLKALAEKATAGLWKWFTHIGVFTENEDGSLNETICSEIKFKDAEFIASANPSTIKSLVEEILEARKLLPRVKKGIEEFAQYTVWVGDCETACDAIESHLKRFGERDE